jgi:acetoacetyl-[acyl-carrier protein] synthase
MANLPVIVGFGGISPAGRSSFHQGYCRLVADAIETNAAVDAYVDLAMLMGLVTFQAGGYQVGGVGITKAEIAERFTDFINDNTLIRKIQKHYLDVDAVNWNQATELTGQNETPIQFEMRTGHLPSPLPENWLVSELDKRNSTVKITGSASVLLPSTRDFMVKSAGQLPTGLDLSKAYKSRSHPRGLQMTMYGASDAIQSMGIEWDRVLANVAPDKISVYASSAMSQLDADGNGGLMGNRLQGKKVTSKNLALGLTEMPADFINAYLLGSLGSTGGNTGACASFLYNLKMGVEDIQLGRSRVVIVGGSEAPITSEVIDGYGTMGALATAANLQALDEGASEPDYKRACRPFSDNCGFTLSESAQFVVLFDDALAIELGANILGAVDNVFVNADGYKKSISSPGLGNWLTVAKAVASARSIVGDKGIQRSYVQAHGTGTPQNRVSESQILNQTAKSFGIKNWTVTGIKSYLGHSIGTSAGDQLMATLGTWQHGVIPGIHSIDHLAHDVEHSDLNILMDHKKMDVKDIDVTFLNSKGFGGNNATAGILAPHIARELFKGKYTTEQLLKHDLLNFEVSQKAKDYNQACLQGKAETIYRFDYNVLQGKDIQYTSKSIRIPGWADAINLELSSPYADMLK